MIAARIWREPDVAVASTSEWTIWPPRWARIAGGHATHRRQGDRTRQPVLGRSRRGQLREQVSATEFEARRPHPLRTCKSRCSARRTIGAGQAAGSGARVDLIYEEGRSPTTPPFRAPGGIANSALPVGGSACSIDLPVAVSTPAEY